MTIKPCTGCSRPITTRNAKSLQRKDLKIKEKVLYKMLWFNCAHCGSTCVIKK